MREEAGYREAPASQNKLWSPLRREDDGEGARLVQRFYLLDLEKTSTPLDEDYAVYLKGLYVNLTKFDPISFPSKRNQNARWNSVQLVSDDNLGIGGEWVS